MNGAQPIKSQVRHAHGRASDEEHSRHSGGLVWESTSFLGLLRLQSPERYVSRAITFATHLFTLDALVKRTPPHNLCITLLECAGLRCIWRTCSSGVTRLGLDRWRGGAASFNEFSEVRADARITLQGGKDGDRVLRRRHGPERCVCKSELDARRRCLSLGVCNVREQS